jgi:hypothetical protein
MNNIYEHFKTWTNAVSQYSTSASSGNIEFNKYSTSTTQDGVWSGTADSSCISTGTSADNTIWPYNRSTHSGDNIIWTDNGWTTQPTITQPITFPTTISFPYVNLETTILDKDDLGVISLQDNKLIIRLKDGKIVEVADLDDSDEVIVSKLKSVIAKKILTDN